MNELVEYGDMGDLELPPHLAELLEGEAQVEVLVDLGVAIAAGTGGMGMGRTGTGWTGASG